MLIFLALFAPGRTYHAIEQFGAWQGLSCNKSECLCPSGLIGNLAPSRAYHAFCILFEYSFPFWRLAGLTMQVMYHFDFIFLTGARQGLPCFLCIIWIFFSFLVPGRAYHASYVSFWFYFIFLIGARQGLPCNKSEWLRPSWLICNLAPGRAYHAIYVLCWFFLPYLRPAGLTMQLNNLVPGRAYHAMLCLQHFVILLVCLRFCGF